MGYQALTPTGKTPQEKNKDKISGEDRENSGELMAECSTAVEDSPETSADRRKKGKMTMPKTKQVAVREDGEGGTFTISATLDSK